MIRLSSLSYWRVTLLRRSFLVVVLNLGHQTLYPLDDVLPNGRHAGDVSHAPAQDEESPSIPATAFPNRGGYGDVSPMRSRGGKEYHVQQIYVEYPPRRGQVAGAEAIAGGGDAQQEYSRQVEAVGGIGAGAAYHQDVLESSAVRFDVFPRRPFLDEHGGEDKYSTSPPFRRREKERTAQRQQHVA
ncbi:unnamed protein product [Amoebophrya sp. A25]|nr:unnamed protein product [Amoebophrya sp. A25]|eukprot:GSA25T00015086001.1